MMHAISETLGSSYFIFLQPTLGVSKIREERYNDLLLFEKLEESYLLEIRRFYSAAREVCDSLNYCFDISSLFDEHTIDVYSDARHPNAIGNKIIASKVWEVINR